jgi:UDP:flavonoid glycosyltransferase YjiC (YdhE family)
MVTAGASGQPVVAVFAMPLLGHLSRVLPVVSELCRAGAAVHVFGDLPARPAVERAGGRFTNLFAGRPVEGVDHESLPMSVRFVTFAGRHADDIVREVAAIRPSLVVHDTFAVIGRVVAFHLGVPRVNLCAGHNLVPSRILAALPNDVPPVISRACRDAVDVLRARHGIPDASPFSYVDDVSPDLNLYAEPPQFLPLEARARFEPLAFFGSLQPDVQDAAATEPSPFGAGSASKPFRVYVSFGTIIWRFFAREALDAMETIADVVASMPDACALVSLGGSEPTGRAAGFVRHNVRVESYVDQVQALRHSSVCVTHQGLNSTHEAVYHGVPMVSYPFFWDQPDLAARCEALGLAIPLVRGLRQPVSTECVRSAFARVVADRPRLASRLAEAKAWELDVVRARPAMVRRALELIR